MKKEKSFDIRRLTFLGILVALVVVLQLFGSAVPLPGGLTLNFSLIPIAMAAILLGPVSGGIVGFAAGMVTYITCAILAREPFTYLQFQLSPVLLTIFCLGKTTVAGFVSGLCYKLLKKVNNVVSIVVSSLIVPLVNTTLYVVLCLLVKDAVIQLFGLETSAIGVVFVTVIGAIWINFLLEVAVTSLLSPAIVTITNVVNKTILRGKK